MPRRFKQVRRRLSAFVRVGDCRPRSVKTLVSESAYMGNSALPSGLECGGSLQREVQPLCNRCRSGLELRFEPVQPGLQAAKPWASPQSFPARAVLRSAQSMAEIRKKDRRNGLQRSFCHRRFPVRFQLQLGNRSKRALSLAVLPMGQAVSQTAPHSGRCSASAYPACWAPASTAHFPIAGGSGCTLPEKALEPLVHEIAV